MYEYRGHRILSQTRFQSFEQGLGKMDRQIIMSFDFTHLHACHDPVYCLIVAASPD